MDDVSGLVLEEDLSRLLAVPQVAVLRGQEDPLLVLPGLAPHHRLDGLPDETRAARHEDDRLGHVSLPDQGKDKLSLGYVSYDMSPVDSYFLLLIYWLMLPTTHYPLGME